VLFAVVPDPDELAVDTAVEQAAGIAVVALASDQ